MGAGRLCAAAVVVALAAGCARDTRPNVLLVTIDTLRADHCSLYGYERATTPRLEELAQKGSVFEAAYAPMATTAPSHATLFTGLLPRHHGVVKNGLVLGQGHETLAESFKHHGYKTGALVSSFVLNRRFGLDQGFESYDDAFPSDRATAQNRLSESLDAEAGFDQRADRVQAKALGWLESRGYLKKGPAPQPFFLWVHYFDPHAPYDPPKRYRKLYTKRGTTPWLTGQVGAYDGELRFVDESIGALADSLESAGRLEDTLLVVTADHDEGLMTHGHMFHGLHLYEEAMRVPLVVRWPRGLPAPRRLAEPVSHADLRPTLLELASLPAGAPGDGTSLAGRLRGGSRGGDAPPIFFQRRRYDGQREGAAPVVGSKWGLRLGDFKYIVAADEGTTELFDLSKDPGETKNLAGSLPREQAALEKALQDWHGRRSAFQAETDASAETREALRALGYVE